MDEDRSIRFVNARPRAYEGKPFLHGRAGTYGTKKRATPFTGTLIGTAPDRPCRVLLKRSVIPMEPPPDRPVDLVKGKAAAWVEGAEWLYAGASPIVAGGCSCPRQHLGMDWYGRALVPEAYRHSIGVVDANGNLIMHVGSYGNFDDAPGGRNGAKPGGADIGISTPRFISATDNYLVYGDWAEKLVVLKLDYHAEEKCAIMAQ
jgi:hypothetical protein